MPTSAERNAKRILQGDVAENKSQVQMAEETLRLLRDGDRLNEQVRKELEGQEPPAKRERGGMEPQKIVNVLGALVFALFGWMGNTLWQTVQAMQGQVTQLNVELARNYAPRLEMQANFDRINAKLDVIEKNTKGQR